MTYTLSHSSQEAERLCFQDLGSLASPPGWGCSSLRVLLASWSSRVRLTRALFTLFQVGISTLTIREAAGGGASARKPLLEMEPGFSSRLPLPPLPAPDLLPPTPVFRGLHLPLIMTAGLRDFLIYLKLIK